LSELGAPPFPVQDYVATIRVSPIIADGASFVEWLATFDCAAEERDKWVRHFEQEGFAKWLAALRQFVSNGRCPRVKQNLNPAPKGYLSPRGGRAQPPRCRIEGVG
jgi:hypothetical protein